MRIRRSWAIILGAIPAGLLVSCGGGGMGGYGLSNMPMTPMASVAFTSPAQPMTVNYGESVKLAWTSTGVATCTASTSSAMGGAFSGNQPGTGSATVVPTGTGKVVYTLSCTAMTGTGAYGGTGAGTTMASTMTVTVSPSILSTLTTITPVGSTLDPIENGGNPYGLALAPMTAGLITAGDLVICNFNDGATNTQGAGTTIVGLHPTAGAKPYHIAQSPALKGCDALAMLPDGSIAAAAYAANQFSLVTAMGALEMPFSTDTFGNPWGAEYAAANGQNPAALYVSNGDGSIDRIALNGDTQGGFAKIATGFCASGQPGAVFAPAGLTYDPKIDTLYIVDTSSNSVVAFANVSGIGAAGVVVSGNCNSVAAPPTPAPTFSGPSAMSARVIAHGSPFIAPISAALLSDGDLIVGNGDVNIATNQMSNLVIEVSPVLPGGFVGAPMQLDTSGTPGALFGIVATTDSQGHQIVFFNDDNTNSVMMLSDPPTATGMMPPSY